MADPSLGPLAPLGALPAARLSAWHWRRSRSISPSWRAAALVALVPARKEEVPRTRAPPNPAVRRARRSSPLLLKFGEVARPRQLPAGHGRPLPPTPRGAPPLPRGPRLAERAMGCFHGIPFTTYQRSWFTTKNSESTAPRSGRNPARLVPPRTHAPRPAAGRASATSPITNRRVFLPPQRTVISPPVAGALQGRCPSDSAAAAAGDAGGGRCEETAARFAAMNGSALGRRTRPGRWSAGKLASNPGGAVRRPGSASRRTSASSAPPRPQSTRSTGLSPCSWSSAR